MRSLLMRSNVAGTGQQLESLRLVTSNQYQGPADSRKQARQFLLRSPPHRRVFSQGAQDGTLEYIFHHIGTTNKFYVVRLSYFDKKELH